MHSMTISPEDLLGKLLAEYHLPLSAKGTHSDFFAGLTASEKTEVFSAKQGLFKSMFSLAKKITAPENPQNYIVDFACFLIAIDLAKRPSFHKNRQLEGGVFPDFTEVYIRDKKKTHVTKNYVEIKSHFYEKIKKWRAEKVGWRRIAEGINKSSAGIDINFTTLMRIYRKIELENAQIQDKKNESK